MIKKFTKGKICVFIDAANIFYSQQTLGWRLDYGKLKTYLESQGKLEGIHYYTGMVGTQEKQSKFIKRLQKLGYQVTAKEVKMIKISKNKFVPKGNLDIELALDAFRFADYYDTLLLFSGDSDFAYLIDLLKAKNKWVIVFSTRGHVARELLQKAKYIDLRKLRKIIEYEKTPSANKNQEPKRTPEV